VSQNPFSYKARGWAPRDNKRFPVHFEARLRNANSFHWFDGRVVNLSRTGICIHSRAQLDASKIIEIEVKVPPSPGTDGGMVVRKLLAQVMWHKGFRYGLKFIEATDDRLP
jgi:hypothetical protein